MLNHNVDVEADTENVKDKDDDFFKRFDVVCLTDCSTEVMVCAEVINLAGNLFMFSLVQVRLNELCRASGIKFFCGDVWGFYGYFFLDLQEHEYSV